MATMAQIDALLEKHGLMEIRQRLVPRIKHSIDLQLTAAASHAVGHSRLGGIPDLGPGDGWPTTGTGKLETALTFIGQIALNELPQNPAVSCLPKRGLLSFFYDTDGWPWGHSPTERSGWRVIYLADASALQPVPNPARGNSPLVLPSFSISFVPGLTVPSSRSIELDELKLLDDQLHRYLEFRRELVPEREPSHHLFGHPDGIQGCMQRTVQFASRDLHLPEGVDSYYEHPRAAELIPGAFDWQLLLQVDSDNRFNSYWGDAGRLYYWMHKDDLAAGRFGNAWLFMQCG